MTEDQSSEIVRLENWKLVESGVAMSTSPALSFRLRGRVYGHLVYPDGDKLTTSEILRVEKNVVYCRSRRYLLGEPATEYIDSLAARGLTYRPEEPIQ